LYRFVGAKLAQTVTSAADDDKQYTAVTVLNSLKQVRRQLMPEAAHLLTIFIS